MGISLQGIGAVGKEQLISSCSNGEPNWSYIPTKGKISKTQVEFVSEIKASWRDYLESAIIGNILFNNSYL